MHHVTVIPVETSRQRQQFLDLPWRLHHRDSNWVPPLAAEQKKLLHPQKGPFYQHGEARLWLAMRGNIPVGRISSHSSQRYDKYMGGKKGFFGFFECENDSATAEALFDAAECHLRENGRTEIEGPFSFSIYDELGILVDGFDSMPAFLVPHTPRYYPALIENAGFEKSIDWLAFRGKTDQTGEKRTQRLMKLADTIKHKRGLTLRPINMRAFDRDAAIVKDLFDRAWHQNWGHVPMSDREFWAMAKGLKQIIVPGLSFIAEVDGKTVGMSVSIYDINPLIKKINGKLFPTGFLHLMRGIKKTTRFRVLLMGVEPAYRGKGYEVAMYIETIREAMRLGFDEAEMSLIVESNQPMLNSLKNLATRETKRLRIYRKNL